MMSADAPKKKHPIRTTLFVLFLFFIVTVCLGIVPPPLLVVMYLPFAWVAYLGRVLPKVHGNSGGVITAAVCFVGSLLLMQVFVSWLWRETARAGRWKFQWTVASVLLIALMFVAGISIVGMTHQTAWMIRSPSPMFEYDFHGRLANRIKCAANMKQIMNAIAMYAQENGGKYPPSLGALMLSEDVTAYTFMCPTSDDWTPTNTATTRQAATLIDAGHTSFGYLGHGLDASVPADTPILTEPLSNHDGDGMNIAFADGHAEWFSPAEAEKVLNKRWGTTRPITTKP